MIKKYDQFVNKRINEDLEEEFDTNQQESELANRDLEEELDQLENDESIDDEEEQMEEEGGDVYSSKLQEVADKLGTEVVDGKVIYNNKKIMFPSETEMYHVSNKKFKTPDEVVSYLENDDVNELSESKRYKQTRKSYKHTRKFK